MVVPHFNYGAYLPIAVQSILDQPDVDVDVIIVDDKSTDGTSVEVARRLASEEERVSLIEHPVNRRHIATYNDGLAAARGDYVVLLSADDALAPGSLARSTALMEANPSVGLVYGTARTFSDSVPDGHETVPAWAGAKTSWTVWSGSDWLDAVGGQGRNLIANPEVVMRRDVLNAIGGYDARFPHSADLYLWLQAAARSDVGRINGTVQAYYRVHEMNMHSVQFGGLLDDYSAVRDTFDTFLDEESTRLTDPERLRRRARRAISREAIRRTVVLPIGSPIESTETLLKFAASADPSDSWRRELYRAAHRSGLVAPLRAAERFRWRVRHHRELRFGV